uniref:Katanin p60 ATPase-containing subunit A1 n=1 Tax=Albugo laibachii Nc14 TaxID=890382 RepID=F0WK32_9STRA|nr:katanin p60 ATPasecontaining subunit putative [Albugo laibachii Nc14]|eukprot:CCA21634.1 katanin p60 ATPasecontaining subunit putative [Albugo laibachii Nc14]
MRTENAFQFGGIRAIGETLVHARRLSQESQYEEGIPLYKNALELLGKFIQALENMSERQKWLQMQIEIENEYNLIINYIEMTRSLQRRQKNCTQSSRSNQERDPDVWSPVKAVAQRICPPNWVDKAALKKSHRVQVEPEPKAAPRGRHQRIRTRASTPEHRKPVRRAQKPDTRREASSRNPNEKCRYSEVAREKGWADLELIEMIEQDIVDTTPGITFESIAGLEHIKQLLQEAVMLPQIAPHLFKDGRLRPCNGVLLFGPPGTGKTLLAKAVATVCKTTFFNVSASTLASKYRGESEKLVRVLFAMARYHSPSIIFMDEIDAIAGVRGSAQEHESSRRVKTELLVQINGVSSGDPSDPSNRVMVLAATNLPWELDEAMRRRLTKRVYIPLPSADGRRQLFTYNLGKIDVAEDVDYDRLVEATEGYSGDDICGLCETAKMMPVKRLYTPQVMKELHQRQQQGDTKEELQAHEEKALIVTWNDFQVALENVSKSVGQDQLVRFLKWEEEFGSK